MFGAIIILLWAPCGSLNAQGMEEGVVEGSGFIGGISLSNGGGNHVHLGGSFGAAARERLFVFGELGYAPLTGRSITTVVDGSPVRISTSVKLLDVGGGLQFILTSGEKFEPYIVGAVGAGRVSSSGSAHVPGTNLDVSTSSSDTKARLGGGAGFRYYLGEKWGIRPEFRVDRYFGDEGSTAFRYTVGIFYQFGE